MVFLFKTIELIVSIGEYADNGRPAIELFDVIEGSPYAVASVNLPHIHLEENEVLIKDYSENEGVMNFLLKNNIVTNTGKIVCHGYVVLNVCLLNPQELWGQPKNYQLQENLN
jgi:hypothetical protein